MGKVWLVEYVNDVGDVTLTGVYSTKEKALSFVERRYGWLNLKQFIVSTNFDKWIGDDNKVIVCRSVDMDSSMYEEWTSQEQNNNE